MIVAYAPADEFSHGRISREPSEIPSRENYLGEAEKSIRAYAKANRFIVCQWFRGILPEPAKFRGARPEYERLKTKIGRGDIVIISNINYIGRGAATEIKDFQSRGVTLIALDVPYMNDFRRMSDANTARMITDIVSALMERLTADSRSKASDMIIRGLDAARENGTALGRPRANLPDGFAEIYETFLGGGYGSISRAAFAEMLGIGRSTLYKYIGLYNESRDNNG